MNVVDLDAELAVAAAALSAETGLAMADSLVLATARTAEATLWTQDSDFAGMEGVESTGDTPARTRFPEAAPIRTRPGSAKSG